jgi:hypothetical protein
VDLNAKENLKRKFHTEINRPGQKQCGKLSHQEGLNGNGRNKN